MLIISINETITEIRTLVSGPYSRPAITITASYGS